MIKKFGITILLILSIFFMVGCEGNHTEEIYIIPHHFNLKAFSYETLFELTFISTTEIDTIEDFSIFFSSDSVGSIDSVEERQLFELDQYKGYYIYVLRVALLGIEGNMYIESGKFTHESEEFSFKTSIRIKSEFSKDIHIVSGDSDADIIIPSFLVYGYYEILKSEVDVLVYNFSFEGNGSFDLNDHITSLKINNTIFEETVMLYENEPFALEITLDNQVPNYLMLIDQLYIEYLDEESGETKDAYILVPLHLFSTEFCAQEYITYILEK